MSAGTSFPCPGHQGKKKKNQDTDDIQYFCFSKKQLITEKRLLQ